MTRGDDPRPAVAGLLLIVFGCAAGSAFAQTAQQPTPAPRPRVTIGYVEIANDARYEPIKAYERMILKARAHPFAAVQVGIDDARALARALKTDFALERIVVKSADQLAPAVLRALDARHI